MTFTPLLATSGGLFNALGINWTALLFYGIAFLIVVAILGRWVYPPLVKALDAKTDELEAAAKLKAKANDELEAARAEAKQIVTEGHVAARELVAGAKAEAGTIVETARAEAERTAQQIVQDGHQQIEQDRQAARAALTAETRQLVASATATLLGEAGPAADERAVERALEAAK